MLKSLQKLLLMIFVLGLSNLQTVQAQKRATNSQLEKDPRVQKVLIDSQRETPSLIAIKNSQDISITKAGVIPFLNELLTLDETSSSLIAKPEVLNTNDVSVLKLQQFFKGIKVEHGVYSGVFKENQLRAISGEFYTLNESLSKMANLSEAGALQKALQFVGASKYAWQYIDELASKSVNIDLVDGYAEAYEKYFPKGELVFVDDYSTKEIDVRLAYKFNVYAAEPISRSYVYVDATSGKILLNDLIIKHANEKSFADQENIVTGSGGTRYAGNRNFDTTFDVVNNQYALKGVAVNGIENETRSLDGVGGIPLSSPALYANSVEIVDNDNNWTKAEHMPDDFSVPYPAHNEFRNDDIGLDAHWGAEVVLQYWFNVHNRSSYDNLGTKVFSYVHYGDAYDNAFWNGEAMTYGDGSAQQGTGGGFLPLTSMDVCAHEIGHGICEFTSNLVYQRESGAMNEGFSDIWGAAVENYVLTQIDGSLPYLPFGIGEQIDNGDDGAGPGDADAGALRWMDDPKAEGNPDSYGGVNWSEPECGEPTLANDQCGVHNNSGVLNKWYYLLVKGSGLAFSPGANKAAADDEMSDGGRAYSVQGIGYDKADKIAFLAETMLSPNSKFIDMRNASIVAAQTLYTISEVEQVTNAWYAVDIGGEFDAGDPNRIIFNSTNILITNETSVGDSCAASKVLTYGLTAVTLPSAQTVTLDISGSTATLGSDFDISQTEFSFAAGSSNATFTITVYNDAVVEDLEKVVMSFVYNAETLEQSLQISDDDVVPVIALNDVVLLETETFDVTTIPAGWDQEAINELSVSSWDFNGTGQAAGKAYVSNGTGAPTYDLNVDANIILKTPVINALGIKDLTVQFDWEAGGEQDLTDGSQFDYGEFMYSLDGANYVSVETYVGSNGGNVVESATYNAVIPALTNTQFILGWRWFNDALVGSAFSFTIDNVSISGTPSYVEQQLDANVSNNVNTGDDVYFVSTANGDIMARIENATEDLGCVEVKVVQAGDSQTVAMSGLGADRTSKVIEITADGENAAIANYDLTLYYTEGELSNFSDFVDLRILKVESSNIDDASTTLNNYAVAGGLENADVDNEYKAYKANFNGFSTFAVTNAGNVDTTILHQGFFETGLDGWVLIGEDAARYSGNRSYEGDYSVRLRDDRNSSTMTMKKVRLNETFATLNVDFYFKAIGMDAGETFQVEYYDGIDWNVVGVFTEGVDYVIKQFYHATVTINSADYAFPFKPRFKFRGNGSGRNDHVYIDQVTIIGTQTAAESGQAVRLIDAPEGYIESDDTIEIFTLYPNPTDNILNVRLLDPSGDNTYRISNMLGQSIQQGKLDNETSISVAQLQSGVYFIEVTDGDESFIKRFVKQ